ncbi:MAG: HAD family phosphatase [Bacteroidetes bacterium]|nr:HAD family phosphatase [Bacteroidota bacterium]MBU1421824.1 HAD family phosphatase [Bacteroidota bacterium]MBU2636338.1 HAD family phosphatase [Bacteroidota bacterium]
MKELSNPKTKAIVFDLGNTLVTIDYKPFLINMGIDGKFSEEEIYHFLAEPTQKYECGKLDTENFYLIVKQQLKTDVDFDRFKLAWCSVATGSIDGIQDLITLLKTKYPLYLLSNTNELHFDYILSNFPVLNDFRKYFLSYQIGLMKPEIEIYIHMLNELNLKPEEIFFIDDKKINIERASRLGIDAHLFSNTGMLIQSLKSKNILEWLDIY